MALDEALLEAAPRINQPVFRLYGWKGQPPRFGYFQHHDAVSQMTALRPLIRRPHGGRTRASCR